MDVSKAPLNEWTAERIIQGIQSGVCTARDVTEAVFDCIQKTDVNIHSFLTLNEADALAKADEVDRNITGNKPVGALAGVPIGLKDLLCTKGLRTTCASQILENFIPPYDATVVSRLRDADAIIVGKLNMDEFAMGSSNENSSFGPARNPHDTKRVAGGSSGGSAAAVASNQATLALGSDTGGSIRLPASFCGVVGMKPTYGLVSRYGLIAFASSLDQIGPLGRTVSDVALLLSVIAGHDPCDSTSARASIPDYSSTCEEGVQGMTVGVPREFFAEGLDPEIDLAVRQGISSLEQAGAQIKDISLPMAGHPSYAIAAYYLIATAEASSNLARYDGVKYGKRAEADNLLEMYKQTRNQGFGPEVKRRIMLGTYALSAGYYDAYYLKAQRVRTLIKDDFGQAFEDCDLVATPVSPAPPFKLGEKIDDPLQMYLSDIYTVSVNLAGIPGISVPCGKTKSGLPIGVQILGPAFSENSLFRAARVVEKAL